MGEIYESRSLWGATVNSSLAMWHAGPVGGSLCFILQVICRLLLKSASYGLKSLEREKMREQPNHLECS